MNRHAYQRVLESAHGVRIMARSVAGDGGLLDEALAAIAHADMAGELVDPTLYRDRRAAMMQDEATLRAVRLLARLGDNDLAGAVAAPEPANPPDPWSAGSTDLSAPAPARNVSMGAGSAPEPEPACLPRAGGSSRGTHAPAPTETLASDPGARRLRMGPAALARRKA